MFTKFSRLAVLTAAVLMALPAASRADESDGFKLSFNFFFGKESERKELRECENLDADSDNILGAVNAFFCTLEKGFGITDPPTAAHPVSATKSFGGRTVHVELTGEAGSGSQTGQGFAADGTASANTKYDYLAKVWLCKAASNVICTSTANFKPALAMVYSYKTDGTVNEGYLLEDPMARDDGNQGAALSLIYNVGSQATTKKMSVKGIDGNGDKMRIDGSESNSVEDVVMVIDRQSTAQRFATRVDTSKNTAAVAFAQNVALTDNTVSTGNPPANPDPVQCFTRTASADDWDYTLNPSGSCAVSPYVDSVATVNAYTQTSILGIDSKGNWSNGMSPSPSSL